MPAGSKKFVGMNKKTGRALIIDQSGSRGKAWREVCQKTAKLYYQGELIESPIYFETTFFLKRPKSHFTSKGSLTKSAPQWHVTKPDKTKLRRAIEDALTGVIWKDDSQLISGRNSKEYGNEVFEEGCLVQIKTIEQTTALEWRKFTDGN